MNSVICILGPTACGKSSLALRLAEELATEIVSVDSVMIYRGMDIGTAKPSLYEQGGIPHHLIDICDPATRYSVAQFCQDSTACIDNLHAQGKTPVLVGGSMMYWNALQHGYTDLPQAPHALRESLNKQREQRGLAVLYEYLQAVDPVTAGLLKANDKQRIQRAIEVYELTRKPLSEHLKVAKQWQAPYHFITIGLACHDRQLLHKKIATRFDSMLDQGLVNEVDKLYQRGDLSLETSAVRSVGYRQVWQHLAGDLSYEAMRERAVIATRQLAKRQCTWLRQWKTEINWYEAYQPSLLAQVVDRISQDLQPLAP